LNHIRSIDIRRVFLEKIMYTPSSVEILERHFKNRLSTQEALQNLSAITNKWVQNSEVLLEEANLRRFVQRGLVEFHPCDDCNLDCHGCTYFQDSKSKPMSRSFPFSEVLRVLNLFRPTAVTVAGGGDPALYQDAGKKLGDLIQLVMNTPNNIRPAVGLISNGTRWPAGNSAWHLDLRWIRFSLDAGSSETYRARKGHDYFDTVLTNVFRVLSDTSIPKVGIGFVYDSENIADGIALLGILAHRLQLMAEVYIQRVNVQFRPWQPPVGKHDITMRAISEDAYENAGSMLLRLVSKDEFAHNFVKKNTNIAVNLLCRGAHDSVKPFSQCYFGLAKTVVRADGTLYPCFRKAALRDSTFCFGNVLTDAPSTIALNQAYVFLKSVKESCVPAHKSCFLCVFNNIIEEGMAGHIQPDFAVYDDYFF
jgi:sulfatase maturation enzyme AslB (radical SAM superfamily)